MDWHSHLLSSPEQIAALLSRTRRIAVLGIKTEAQTGQPAYSVPAYMQRMGFEVVPVPVYFPDVTQILGQAVYRRVSDIPGAVDMVNVFRRPEDIDQHVDDVIQKAPGSVWFQLGIVNDAAAEKLARAGIDVVQNKCLMVEHRLHA